MTTLTQQPGRRRPWLIRILTAVIAVLLLGIGFLVAMLLPGLHPGGSGFSLTVGKPTIVSEQQLREYGSENGTVYWAGVRADSEFELTRSSSGATFIRYLPDGVKAGSKDKYLTVATYPEDNGYGRLRESVTAKTLTASETKSGALVVINPQTVNSTYFSFPKANFQVEVFSPEEGQSKSMVLDGDIDILGVEK